MPTHCTLPCLCRCWEAPLSTPPSQVLELYCQEASLIIPVHMASLASELWFRLLFYVLYALGCLEDRA